MNQTLLYVAAALTAVWGIAHLFATRGVVALISTAAFVTVATVIDFAAGISIAVYAVAIATLLVLAVVSLFTGFRVAFLPFRLCPVIFGASALLIALGAWL
jgi:hypothetical protein